MIEVLFWIGLLLMIAAAVYAVRKASQWDHWDDH